MVFRQYFSGWITVFVLLSILSISAFSAPKSTPLIINHTCCKLDQIPAEWINAAKADLHIAYGHTSHGSQLISGMNGLKNWKGNQYAWNNGGADGALDLHDEAFEDAYDLGNPDRTSWATATRTYLNKSENSDVNVIIWSWCGQAGSASEGNIETYLSLMTQLEIDFPAVNFVYMTGHLDGGGEDGNLHQRNEQIRKYCQENGKTLYDFADIESWDPDGNYYLDKFANDNCDYDSDGDGSQDRNWAEDWQASHTKNADWFDCSAAHSKPLNGNLKAYAAWWLWASLTGWNPTTGVPPVTNYEPRQFTLSQNYPNPFNPVTRINYNIGIETNVRILVYNVNGQLISTLLDENKTPGHYSTIWDATDDSGMKAANGIYLCKMETGTFSETRRMILLK